MPQRHHGDINAHRNSWRSLSNAVCRWCSLAAACFALPLTPKSIISTPLCWKHKKWYANNQSVTIFKEIRTTTGTYQVDIWLNKKKVSQKKITFTANAEQLLQPQFTVEQLRELGIKVDEIPALAEKDDDSVINSLEQIIPGTAAEFDFNHQRLNLSIPQIALYRDARGYVSPSRWDDGIPTLFYQLLVYRF